MAKAREEEGAKKVKTISAPPDEPHSILDEVFSWVPQEITRDQLVKRSTTAEKIGTPKMQTRSIVSPSRKNSSGIATSFSPMTLSRAAVKSMADPSSSSGI